MVTFDLVRRRRAGTTPVTRVAPSGALRPEHAGRTQVHQILHTPQPQAKLTVGPPGDAYEQEADRVADAVMRMPDAEVQEGQVQRVCTECEEELQRAPAGPGGAPSIGPEVESGIQSLRGGGQPLPDSERAYFEPRFGRDFGDVRIHADARAATVARSVSARAFTLGRSIAFGEGAYAPGSSESRRLLAHELTHVVQQRGDGAGTVQRQAAPDAGTPAPAADAGTPAPAPDAGTDAGTAPCPIAPLAAITDADALAMEGGTRLIWNHTAPNLQTCANNLVGLIQGAGGTAGITSAYRPQAYQDHLREVWDKARALRSHPETSCDAVRTAVNAEMAGHRLDVDGLVARVSNHLAGNAVDISWTLPAALTPAICQMPAPDAGAAAPDAGVPAPAAPTEEECIDNLAVRAGMTHALHGADRPHFEI